MGIILPTKKVYSRIREYKTGEVEYQIIDIYEVPFIFPQWLSR